MGNFVLNKSDGKVYIIDTDVLAMPPLDEVKRLREDYIKNGKGYLHSLSVKINDTITKLEISMYSKWCSHTRDAYSFLHTYITYREAIRVRLAKESIIYMSHEVPGRIIKDAIDDVIKTANTYDWKMTPDQIKSSLKMEFPERNVIASAPIENNIIENQNRSYFSYISQLWSFLNFR
jgi:hypothetical protein